MAGIVEIKNAAYSTETLKNSLLNVGDVSHQDQKWTEKMTDKTTLVWKPVIDFPENAVIGSPVVRVSSAEKNGRTLFSMCCGRLGDNGRVMPHYPIFTTSKHGIVTVSSLVEDFAELIAHAEEYARVETQKWEDIKIAAQRKKVGSFT
jgi:hypothetical protein